MPGECLRDVALGQRCWLRDGFDLVKLRRRSSTPAVVPGAAPALAKAGVGGLFIPRIYAGFLFLLGIRRAPCVVRLPLSSPSLYQLVSITRKKYQHFSLKACLYHIHQSYFSGNQKSAIIMRESLPVGNLRHFSSRNPYLCPFSCLMFLISWSGLWIFVLHILQKFSTPLGWDPAGLDALNAELQVQHLRTEQRQLVKKQRHYTCEKQAKHMCT
jgi:hypothetical protein